MTTRYSGRMLILDHLEWVAPVGVYRCRVHLLPEVGGGYSVFATDLPGAASQGDDIPDALRNITEALSGVLSVYRDEGVPVPWSPRPAPPGALVRVVFPSVG